MLIKTKNGILRGEETDGTAIFLGIPYAKAPIGELRWKAPLPAEDWEGIREATEFGHASAQPIFEQSYADKHLSNAEPMSEDCLYLNVWAPKKAAEENKGLPVLFVIHGGGFKYFSGSTSALNGFELAKQDVVVVTINYRLGIMGFFAHPELSRESENGVSGNYAILDQIAALKWVNENISAFGGDPDQVTICGESAGAFSVSVLCASPLAKGLFEKATAQSGSYMDKKTVMYTLMDLQEAESHFSALVGGKSLSELRNMSTQEMIDLLENAEMKSVSPICDDYVFPSDIKQAIKDGRINDVPLLIGSNRDEGTLFAPQSGNPDELAAIAAHMLGAEKVQEFLKIYPNDDKETTIRSMIQFFGDSSFTHNMYSWAKELANHGKNNVYLYYYCLVPPSTSFGAHHSSELVYFFHNLCRSNNAWTQRDFEMENMYSSYIMNFIKTGNPNGEGLPLWTPFAENKEEILIMDDKTQMETNPRLEAMRFWDSVCE